MVDIGNYNELEVARAVEFGVYLNSEDGEILLPNKYVPENIKPGDMLRVFVYRDSEDRMIATTLEPKATVGEFAALEVKQVNDYGAFLDWGLEKDLFVPFHNQKDKMQPGRKYVVYIYLDDTSDRIVATAKLGKYFHNENIELQPGQKVDLLVAGFTEIGVKVIINNRYLGILYKNEVFQQLRLGDKTTGYIKQIRPDNKIDVSLQKTGYSEVEDAAEKILSVLQQSKSNTIPLTDKSSSEEISQWLGMSKKTFKKAIGNLYKNQQVTLEPDQIRLKK